MLSYRFFSILRGAAHLLFFLSAYFVSVNYVCNHKLCLLWVRLRMKKSTCAYPLLPFHHLLSAWSCQKHGLAWLVLGIGDREGPGSQLGKRCVTLIERSEVVQGPDRANLCRCASVSLPQGQLWLQGILPSQTADWIGKNKLLFWWLVSCEKQLQLRFPLSSFSFSPLRWKRVEVICSRTKREFAPLRTGLTPLPPKPLSPKDAIFKIKQYFLLSPTTLPPVPLGQSTRKPLSDLELSSWHRLSPELTDLAWKLLLLCMIWLDGRKTEAPQGNEEANLCYCL